MTSRRSLEGLQNLWMVALFCGACAESIEPSVDLTSTEEIPIVGGAPTTIDEHPWQVSLQLNDQSGGHFCGGSIIGPDWILTAQHCVDAVTSPIIVVAGVTRLSQSSRQVREVARIIRYPDYNSPAYGKDVALLGLSSALELNARVQVIALASPSEDVIPGTRALTTGWGKTGSGRRPDILRVADVPIVAQHDLQQRYGWTIGDDQIGAGGEGRDTCFGDSGGPLSVASRRGRVLVGVTSWGSGCGESGFPGMYARVSFFAEWIRAHIGEQTTVILDERDLAGARASFTHFRIENVSTLTAMLIPSSGDPDLYVRRGARPTLEEYDCRPFLGAVDEACEVGGDDGGAWYVSVYGYSEYAGAALSVSGVVTSSSKQVLAADDFGAGDWNGGFGFEGAWTRQGDVALSNNSARLRRSSGDLQRTIDVSGTTSLSLTFRARVDAFESDDRALVLVSVDGGPFVALRAIDDGDGVHAIDLSAFDGASKLTIRFDAEMNASTDSLYIDDVTLTGQSPT